MDLRPPRVPPLALVGIAAVAQQLISRRGHSTALSRVAGWALAASSVALTGSSVALFRRSQTTVDPVDPGRATTLVTDGVHRHTRNPMYVGMAGLLVGHAVSRRSWLALLPVAAFIAAIHRSQIPAEEAALHQRFGAAYEEYVATTPRWVRLR